LPTSITDEQWCIRTCLDLSIHQSLHSEFVFCWPFLISTLIALDSVIIGRMIRNEELWKPFHVSFLCIHCHEKFSHFNVQGNTHFIHYASPQNFYWSNDLLRFEKCWFINVTMYANKFNKARYLIFLCPPSKKRGIRYCFEPVGRSVDQKMSAHYLENLSLDGYISYMDWWWVEEDPC
jgi:hypothetical protein